MKTLYTTLLISVLMVLSFCSSKNSEQKVDQEDEMSHGTAWRFGNVKSWNVNVTLDGSLSSRESDGSYDSLTLSTEVSGTIEDKALGAGKHYIWPFGQNVGGGLAGSNLTTKKVSYRKVQHIPAEGTVPEDHKVCTSNKSKTTAGLNITPNGNVYGIWVELASMDLTCTSEDILNTGDFRVDLNQLPMGVGNVLEGTKTILGNDGITYTVSWKLTPAVFD